MNGDEIPIQKNPLNQQQQWQQEMANLSPEMTQANLTDEVHLKLMRRIMDLEGCLVYVRNFLPEPLKKHAEEVLWPDRK